MANELRICGVVHNVEAMETRTSSSGDTFYSQRFNLSYDVTTRDGRIIRKYATLRLEGNNINRYAELITSSYLNGMSVTAWVDIAKNSDEFFIVNSVYRMEEGDRTIRYSAPAQTGPESPVVGIAAMGPASR